MEEDIFTVSTPFPDGSGGIDIVDRTGHRDRLGQWTYYSWTPNRQLASVTDARNHVTAYGYCVCGSLDSVTNGWNSPVEEVTRFTYDGQGNVLATFPPLGAGIFNRYDLLGRLATVTDAAGTVSRVYDNLSRLSAVKDAAGLVVTNVYDDLNRVLASTDRNGVTVMNAYDDLGRLLTRAYPDGGLEQWGYAAGVSGPVSFTNQVGNTLLYTYDASGRKMIEVGPGVFTNSFAYGPADDLLALSDGKNQITTWRYDDYGRVIAKLDQAGSEILRYAYDADGRLTNRWSAARGGTAYFYDAVGNPTAIRYPSDPAVEFQYDELNRPILMSDRTGVTRYTYWPGGLIQSEDGPWPDDTVTYAYNNARQRTGLTLQQPAGTWTTGYDYDPARRLTSVVSPAGAFHYDYSSPLGSACSATLVSRLSLPNRGYITNTYDSVASQSGTRLCNNLDVVLDGHDYVYNAAGQRTRQARADGSYVEYAYDGIGQLAAATAHSAAGALIAGEQFSYAYDASGNLQTRSRTGGDAVEAFVTDGKNQLISGPAGACGYDEDGNLTSARNGYLACTYDDEDELVSVRSLKTYRTDFVYDGRGRVRRRIESSWNPTYGWVATGETRYIYDGMRVIQERDGANNPTVSYTRGNDFSGSLEGAGGIGGLLARSQDYAAGGWSAHSYYHADANGNITCLVDADQNPVATYRYDPFGNTLSMTGPLATANLYRFSSKEFHARSGLYYYGYRFYDPSMQRWMNRDPIGERGGVNLFSFVINAPVNLVDYFGLECGITIRRYKGGAAHQWISDGNNNIGFYPGSMFGAPGTGVWVNEDQFTGQVNSNGGNRPDPSNPNDYYTWDTKKKNHGTLSDGTPCSAATCQQILECINNAINANPAPKFHSLFNNCRQQSKKTLGNCCLSKGSMSHEPPGGRGGFGRSTGDTTGGSSEVMR